MIVGKSKPLIAQLLAHPRLVVRTQIKNQQPAAGPEDAFGFNERCRGIAGVMQRLREQRDVDRAGIDRQLFELAF